jgi:serine/threonine protein kinase
MLVRVSTAGTGGEVPLLGERYRLGPLLGSGGVAEVFRAFDERLQRDVAIKLFRGNVADQLQRHEDEMRLLARLDHASLVTVFDAGNDESNGRPYLVMQLVEGTTLSDQLRSGPLSEQRTAELGGALAEALAYVHGQGLVHRDVKPANVLVGVDGRVSLADFGIARIVDSAHVTRTGDVLGTPAYFAPEQVAGEPVGPPADVYALGLVLLECLTGRREYDGPAMEAAMARLTRQPLLPPTVPAVWRDLLVGMTARQPTARLSAAQAASALHRIAAGDTRTVAAPAATSVMAPSATQVMAPVTAPVPAEPTPARRRVNPAVVLLILLIAAAAAVGIVVGVQRSQNGSGGDCFTQSPTIADQTVETDMQDLEQLACR